MMFDVYNVGKVSSVALPEVIRGGEGGGEEASGT